MKKVMMILAMTAVIAALLVCGNKSNAVGPFQDNAAEEAKLFKVSIVQVYSNGNADVNIYWLADKLDQGDHPFSRGPTQWSSPIMLSSVSRVTIDNDLYYGYDAIVPLGIMQTVSGGLDWNTGVYLSSPMQAGCAYYNPSTDNMAFSVRYNSSTGYYINAGN